MNGQTINTTDLANFIFKCEAHSFKEFEKKMLMSNSDDSIDDVEFIIQPRLLPTENK